jgi:5'-3' exonuclease
MLIGDTVDNIKGVYGIGKVKASKLLDHVYDEVDMFDVVRDIYQDDERLLLNGRLLWIRRERNQLWEFPYWSLITLQPKMEEKPSSSEPSTSNDDPMLEPTSQVENGFHAHGTELADGTMTPATPEA